MNNFLTRTITGALFVTVVIGSAVWDSLLFALVMTIFAIAGLTEFYKLIKIKGISVNKPLGIFIGLAILLVTIAGNIEIINNKIKDFFYLSLFLISIILFFAELFRQKENPFHNVAFTLLGIFYIIIPFSMLFTLSNFFFTDRSVSYIQIIYFLILWTYDTFAYLIGIILGKHRLFERISPKKSWEGAIGGLITVLALSFFIHKHFVFLSFSQWLVFSLIIVIFGTLGDLTESLLKRNVNCKDSGNFFPGHGGVLDRFDSVLLSVPFVYLYLEIISAF